TLPSVGSYSVGEPATPGYDASMDAGCAGTIALGETRTCTVTHNDIQPKLTLVNMVINDDGGTRQPGDFPLSVSGTRVTSGVPAAFNAGNYFASEQSMFGYTTGPWGGDCNPA